MQQQQKSFWQRPEGTTGKIILGGLVIGAGFLLYAWLPFIIILMQNTIHAAMLFIALGAMLFIALDPKFQNLVAFAYKVLVKNITRIFIELDPIAIIEVHIDGLKKNRDDMDRQITNLRSQMGKLNKVITENKSEINQRLKLMSVAEEKGSKRHVMLGSRKVGRLKESNVTLESLYLKMDMLYKVLQKMFENAGLFIEDIEDEVSVKKREREAIRAGHSAFTSAMKIIKGDTDKNAMFEQAMEIMADDVGSKVGEMERFMEMSSTFIESIDLQNGVFQEEGLKMLEEWEQKGDSFLLGDDKSRLLKSATAAPAASNDYIATLLRKE